MSDYQEYRKVKTESGLLYQDWVVDQLYRFGIPVNTYSSRIYQQNIGESRSGIEIKHDEYFKKSGNLWIEIAEKAYPRGGSYVASGIYRNDNTWLYVIGDYDTIFIFLKNTLVGFEKHHTYRVIENRFRTSMGYLLPSKDIYGSGLAKILEPKTGKTINSMIVELEKTGADLHAVLLGRKDIRQMKMFDDNK